MGEILTFLASTSGGREGAADASPAGTQVIQFRAHFHLRSKAPTQLRAQFERLPNCRGLGFLGGAAAASLGSTKLQAVLSACGHLRAYLLLLARKSMPFRVLVMDSSLSHVSHEIRLQRLSFSAGKTSSRTTDCSVNGLPAWMPEAAARARRLFTLPRQERIPNYFQTCSLS